MKAQKLLRKRNSDRYREYYREPEPQNGLRSRRLDFYLLYICAFVENIFAISWQFFCAFIAWHTTVATQIVCRELEPAVLIEQQAVKAHQTKAARCRISCSCCCSSRL